MALGRVVVASIGPICTNALAAHEVRADLEPAHPKMGQLVLAASERAEELLRDKREAQR
jgi:uroporphyrinogen-III synthase